MPQIPLLDSEIYEINVLGKLDWFTPGTPQYIRWLNQRNHFIKYIDENNEEGRKIIEDILDGILEAETPTGIIGVISILLKITKKARAAQKKREAWRKIVNAILKMTFTPTNNPSEDFKFAYAQVNRVWSSYSGLDMSFEDYKILYNNIDTKLRVGKIKEKIILYPELNRYIEYKLRQYKIYFLCLQRTLQEISEIRLSETDLNSGEEPTVGV